MCHFWSNVLFLGANIEHWYKGTCFVCQCILSIFPVAISCKYTCSGSRSVNFKMSFSALKGPGQKLSKFSLVFWSKRWFHFEINWPLMLTCFFIGFPSLQGPVIESLVETWLPRRGDWHLEAQVSWYRLLEDCLSPSLGASPLERRQIQYLHIWK